MTHLLDHPLIQDRLALLRSVDCSPGEFRNHIGQIARLMVPGATADLPLRPTPVQTPLEPMEGHRLARPITLVPILRAGLGLADGFLSLLPDASVAHIGLARDEKTLKPSTYYYKAPPGLSKADVLILDPMLATGGSATEAITRLKEQGAVHLRFICVVASPEGCQRLANDHPDVPIYTAALDKGLDSNGYIRPGLGDAGDRIFGTL